ncbi:MAG: ATP-binding protein [Kiritimatiellia bacterium]
MENALIKRGFYVEKLMSRRMNGFVKVITGVRRCGKSYLLDKLFRQRLLEDGVKGTQIISVDLDDKAYVELRNPLKLDEYVRKKIKRGKQTYYVFIDEIQQSHKILPPGIDLEQIAPEDRESAYVTFHDVLNGWRKFENVDVYVTGSNSKMLSNDIATNFRDRGQVIHVWPLSFAEYFPVSGLTDKMEAFRRYLTWGGMPAAARMADGEERAAYLKRLYTEVYFKDIIERHSIREDLVLSNLVDILSSDIGSLTNPHRIGDTMNSLWKIHPSDHTLQNYIGYLEDAFLFSHARRFEVKGRRYLDSPMKYYSTDLGLRNARLNFRDTDPSHPMENVIYNELLRRGYSVDVGVVPIVTRDKEGKQVQKQHEIDFVINRGNDKIYIQSAYQLPTKEKELQETASLRGTGDYFKKIVITEGYGEPMADQDGIIRMGIIPFLMNEGSVV